MGVKRARRKAGAKSAAVERRPNGRGLLYRLGRWARQASAWLRTRRVGAERKLRLCDSVSLGEKRFAAVLEFEGQRFLVGGAAQSVQLLSELHPVGCNEGLTEVNFECSPVVQ